jgi:hypothetical protein
MVKVEENSSPENKIETGADTVKSGHGRFGGASHRKSIPRMRLSKRHAKHHGANTR